MSWELVVGGVVIVGIVLGALIWLAKSGARKGAEADFHKASVDRAQRAREIDDEVDRLSKSDVIDRLRER